MSAMVTLSAMAKPVSVIIFGGFLIIYEVARCEIFKAIYSGRNKLHRWPELVLSKNRMENGQVVSMPMQC